MTATGRAGESGLLDTSVVIDLGEIPEDLLPRAVSVSAITFAELAAGIHAAVGPRVRAARLDRLQRLEAAFDPIPFDRGAARAYGRIHEAVAALGRSPRRRLADLLIAATAAAQGLPLYTRDRDAVAGLEDLLDVVLV